MTDSLIMATPAVSMADHHWMILQYRHSSSQINVAMVPFTKLDLGPQAGFRGIACT